MKRLLCSHFSSVGNLIKKEIEKRTNFYEQCKRENQNIFRSAAKYIAFLSMLIDHTNKALIYPNLDGGA
mgnify:CR=1 FL=1